MARAAYELTHDGLRARLRSGLTGMGFVATVVVALGAWGVALGGTHAVWGFHPVLAGVALVGLAAVSVFVAALARSRVQVLKVRGRSLTVTRQGLFGAGRPITRTLLSLDYAVATDDGWLVLETDTGVGAVRVPAGGVPHAELRELAQHLTEAMKRAEEHRGEFPDARTREVRQLLER